MSLRLAFLAFLLSGAKHGYELKSEFEELFRGFWDVNAGQIYTTLARMQRDGLVINERVEQDDKPDKKMYTLTEAGRAEVSRMVTSALPVPDGPRDELLVKVFVLSKIDVNAALAMVSKQRMYWLTALREVVQTKLDARDSGKRLILDRSILRIQADLEWLELCDQFLGNLNRRPQNPIGKEDGHE